MIRLKSKMIVVKPLAAKPMIASNFFPPDMKAMMPKTILKIMLTILSTAVSLKRITAARATSPSSMLAISFSMEYLLIR